MYLFCCCCFCFLGSFVFSTSVFVCLFFKYFLSHGVHDHELPCIHNHIHLQYFCNNQRDQNIKAKTFFLSFLFCFVVVVFCLLLLFFIFYSYFIVLGCVFLLLFFFFSFLGGGGGGGIGVFVLFF